MKAAAIGSSFEKTHMFRPLHRDHIVERYRANTMLPCCGMEEPLLHLSIYRAQTGPMTPVNVDPAVRWANSQLQCCDFIKFVASQWLPSGLHVWASWNLKPISGSSIATSSGLAFTAPFFTC